jgi:hypothetical protein
LLVSVLGAAFLFCFFLKWQPVHSRLHLPLFVLFAPFVAVVVEHWPRLIVYSACGLLFILSVPDVFSENGKQLTGPQAIFSKDRSSMRLMYGSYYRKDYGAAIALIKKSRCREIGMIIEHDAWEYPLFAFLGSSYRIEHVNVDNVSTRTRNSRLLESFDPQLIVRVRALYSPNDRFAKPFTNVPVLAYHGNSYQREWSSDLIEIYARSNEPAFIGSLQ